MWDVQLLLLAFGLNSRISKTNNKSNPDSRRYPGYLLAMGAEASDLFHNRVGFLSKRKQSAIVGVTRKGLKPDGRRRPNLMEDTVTEVVPAGREHVYDMTVVDSHRYGANGILVHNCATPEESFQHTMEGALTHEVMETLRLQERDPAVFDLIRAGDLRVREGETVN
jgi:hypothetical protein